MYVQGGRGDYKVTTVTVRYDSGIACVNNGRHTWVRYYDTCCSCQERSVHQEPNRMKRRFVLRHQSKPANNSRQHHITSGITGTVDFLKTSQVFYITLFIFLLHSREKSNFRENRFASLSNVETLKCRKIAATIFWFSVSEISHIWHATYWRGTALERCNALELWPWDFTE